MFRTNLTINKSQFLQQNETTIESLPNSNIATVAQQALFEARVDEKDIQNWIKASDTNAKTIGNYCDAAVRIRKVCEGSSTLRLYNSFFTSLPDFIGKFTNLEILEVVNSKLNEFPLMVLRLKNLRKLSFYYNKIEKIPDAISTLQNLRFLSLADNSLLELPESVGLLVNLEFLIVCGNKLKEIPGTIGNLKLLRHLDLSNNKLTNLPEKLASLGKLEWIDLDFNCMEKFPEVLYFPPNLREVRFRNNPCKQKIELDYVNTSKL